MYTTLKKPVTAFSVRRCTRWASRSSELRGYIRDPILGGRTSTVCLWIQRPSASKITRILPVDEPHGLIEVRCPTGSTLPNSRIGVTDPMLSGAPIIQDLYE